MTFVVDTSVILAVVLNEPSKAALIQVTNGVDLLAPASLHWEIGNAFSAMFKRKRLTYDEAIHALIEYQKIPIRFVDVRLEDAVGLSAELNIYAYDAYFIACARTQKLALLTIDNGLHIAAQSAGVAVVEAAP
jgi:predicted nucleic acid-binding protein